MNTFKNQIVIVSGATRGIGRAITGKFLREGAKVIGIYFGDTTAAHSCEAEYQQYSADLELVKCDITKEDEVKELFLMVEEKHQSLDILVNNAGIRRDAVLALMRSEHWQQVIDTNLTGTYLMAKQAILLMMKKKYGRIINITSPVAHLGFAGQSNYAASKAGQVALTKSLAKEVAKKRITVNCVSPGFISTDFINDLPDAQLSAYKKMVPMRRFGTPEEVGDCVLFLANRGSAYITGTVLEITGGL